MSLQKDPSGRRWVAVEAEVPGTPEEVWEAIATGPGVSSWFVPVEVDPRVGGSVVSHFGPGMDSTATITAWDPPHHFAAESDGIGPGAPPMATEWTVEARDGGKCIVRVVHSLFASTDDWDDQLNSIESGWPAFFRILRMYLTHYRGQPCAQLQVMGFGPEPESATWDALTAAFPLSGAIEAEREGPHPFRLLLLNDPAPGAAFLNVCSMGGQVMVMISFYLYGDRAPEVAARETPVWQAWMAERFPMPTPA